MEAFALRSQVMVVLPRLMREVRDTMSSPGHAGLGHPQEIHVAGQNRKVGIRSCRQASSRVSIAKKDICNQLQVCLPADWLPKKEDP